MPVHGGCAIDDFCLQSERYEPLNGVLTFIFNIIKFLGHLAEDFWSVEKHGYCY